MNGTKILKMKAAADHIRGPEKRHTKPHHLPLPRAASSIAKILVPIDFSIPSKRALEHAAMFARQFGSSITLLHVLKPAACYADYGYGIVLRQFVDDNQIKKANARLDALRKQWLGVEFPAVSIVRTGMPESEIVRAAKELGIGLIVIASNSCATSKNAASSGIAQTVVGLAGCPVLVVCSKCETSLKRNRPKPNLENSLTLN